MRKGPRVIVLLTGSDKSTRDADIVRSVTIAKEWKE